MGIAPSRVAAHLGVGTPTLHRMLLRHRAGRLLAISSAFPNHAEGEVQDADVLKDPAIQADMPLWSALAGFEVPEPSCEDTTRQDLAAISALTHRLHERARSLAGQPSARDVDRAYTDLLWMTKLHWRLALRFQHVVLHAIEIWSGRPPLSLPVDAQRLYFHGGMQRTLDVLLHQRHGDAGRVESRVRAAVNRMLAEHDPPRADLASVRVGKSPQWLIASFSPYQDLLPIPGWEQRAGVLAAVDRDLVTMRWGLGGLRPRTLAEVAHARDQTIPALSRRWSAAQHALVRG